MVMPLEEDNLHNALHERKWQPSTEQLVDLASRLADACAHVHSKGVRHSVVFRQQRSCHGSSAQCPHS